MSRLRVGERLNFGESLVSPNGQHILTFQRDGNLVLYCKGRAEWHTDTANRAQASGSLYAAIQADGNFVVAHKFWGYRWESLSNGYGARTPCVAVENDGIVSIYDDEVDGRHWCSDAFPNEMAGLFNEYALTKVRGLIVPHIGKANTIRRGIWKSSAAMRTGRTRPTPSSRHSGSGSRF